VPDLPVLFMSGYAEEQLRREIDIENMYFIPKPFSVSQIGEKWQECWPNGPRKAEGWKILFLSCSMRTNGYNAVLTYTV
jgi:hypothetical protein